VGLLPTTTTTTTTSITSNEEEEEGKDGYSSGATMDPSTEAVVPLGEGKGSKRRGFMYDATTCFSLISNYRKLVGPPRQGG